MLFNSIDFAIFLPLVFILYWFVFKTLKFQNVLLICASYVFYAWWDWRFLSLIITSTLIDYSIGLAIVKQQQQKFKAILLGLSILLNLGILGFFKYYNFFIENFNDAFLLFGKPLDLNYLNIILPIGISFYTFQTMSYTIDVYREKIKPTTHFIAFASFICFFPQLVAGPIERASNFLPQFLKKRNFEIIKVKDGLRQILWGLFKKMVIADNCAIFVDAFFANPDAYNGSALLLGAFLFSFQIYCDFSGYTDIAIGTSRLFGFNLKRNFNYPYFSRNIAEFWGRWHISLTNWFRDYLYIPLGGSKGSKSKTIRNIVIVFIISALWHGANWTFIFWGIIHAFLFITLWLTNTNQKYKNTPTSKTAIPQFKTLASILTTFFLTTFAWLFFRANDLNSAFNYITSIFSESLFELPRLGDKNKALLVLIVISFLILTEWNARNDNHALEKLGLNWKKHNRYIFYYSLIFAIFYFYETQQQFIYFQF
ncbi:MBOAT family protein [Winogradskyella sp.]|nr:MBOAT family protein [Winogradskyella sp.]